MFLPNFVLSGYYPCSSVSNLVLTLAEHKIDLKTMKNVLLYFPKVYAIYSFS